MNPDRRRVRTLQLKSDRDDVLRRGAAVFREALGVASLPGDGLPGRLLIRRLELGSLGAAVGAQELARRLADAVRAASARAVVMEHPRAPGAEAVRVRTELEPLFELARRACDPRPFEITAWFWPLLIPGLRREAGRQQALTLVIEALTEHAGALAALLDELVEAGRARPVLEVLTRRHAERLLRQAGLVFEPGAAPNADLAKTAVSFEALESRWTSPLSEFVQRWGPDEPRSLWLCFAALVLRAPGWSMSAEREARVLEWARRAARGVASSSPRREPSSSSETTADAGAPGSRRVPTHSSSPDSAAPVDAQFSEFAGLFFLAAVFERRQLRTFLEQHPELAELDFGRRLLVHLADVLEIGEDDPVRWALEGRAHRVRRASLPDPPVLEAALREWQHAIETWLRDTLQISLLELVRRPGFVLATRTHLHVLFDLEQADVQLRRAAIDVNPGYVPYWGRVVTFHYVRGGDLTQAWCLGDR